MLRSRCFGKESSLALLCVNWLNINLYFCRRGRGNQRNLTRNSFVFKKDASGVEYVKMVKEEKTKNHPCGLSS